jgi:4-amino-4-deoxy-L-arabinose transferase-like glycosyltransferase
MSHPESNHPAPSSRQNRSLWALLALTLLLRGGVLLLAPRAFEADPDGYRLIARNILEQGTFGYDGHLSAYRPPLYPVMLAPLMALGSYEPLGIGLLHVLLGVATVAIVVHVGRLWGLGRYALLAGALVAIDPLLLWQSTLVMTETPAAFFTVLGLWALTAAAQRPSAGRAILAGGALGVAALCRPTYLPWMASGALVLPWFAEGWTARLRILVVYGVAGAAAIAPWVVRNQIQYGKPIASTTHGGYTLLLGNNPWFYDYLRRGAWGTLWDGRELDRWWNPQASQATPAEELQSDQRAYQIAHETIRQQPSMFAYACLVRVGRFWSPLPHRTDVEESSAKRWARYAIGAGYVVEFALALIGLAAVLRGRLRSCHPERSEGSPRQSANEILRCAQDDKARSAPHDLAGAYAGRSRRFSWLSTWGWGLLLAAIFTAAHMLYWSNMRAPVMPIVALAAAAGVAHLAGKKHPRK